MRPLSRRTSRYAGGAAIALVCLLQAFNSFACYRQGVLEYLAVLAIFVGIPMAPAILALKSQHPLRAVGGALLFAPWLGLAYYADCVRPYTGGGASMIYVAVVLWGLPSCLVGVWLTVPVARLLGFIPRQDA